MAKRVSEKMFNIIRYQRNANMMPSRNDYLPTRIADMEMPTDLGVGGDLTQLSFSKRVSYWNHLHRPVQCFFFLK